MIPPRVSHIEFERSLDTLMNAMPPNQVPINPDCIASLVVFTGSNPDMATGIDVGLMLGLIIAEKRKEYH